MVFLNPNSPNVLAFKRISSTGESSIVIINSSTTKSEQANIKGLKGKSFMDLLTGDEFTFKNGNIHLDAGGFYILKETGEREERQGKTWMTW